MIISYENFDLTNHTTFAIPVRCNRFIEYDRAEDVEEIVSSLQPEESFMHIGGGSNLLFTSDFDGVVAHSLIKCINIVSESGSDFYVRVGAGVVMDDFIQWACDKNLWGVENLSGIPGEAGASAVQNVGAYGVEASDVIVEINAFDRVDRSYVTIKGEKCQYGYRDSIFKSPGIKGRFVILSVVYRLSSEASQKTDYPALKAIFPTSPDSPRQVREAVLKIRDSKLPDPADVPSAGSFFKNPVVTDLQYRHICELEGGESFPHYRVDDKWKLPAAWLIERCGWKGYHKGNVAVWQKQPLVIVNPQRKATAGEILALEKEIISSVQDRYDVTLTPEVEHI